MSVIITPGVGGGGNSNIQYVIKTADDTLESSDRFKTIEYQNGSSDFEFTFPLNSSDAIPIGAWGTIRKTGTGKVDFLKEGGGITFRSFYGDVLLSIDGVDGMSVFWQKTDTDEFYFTGNYEAT